MVDFDALVVAGGRSSRLGGQAKALLDYNGSALVTRTVAAVRGAGAQRIVVVGPQDVLHPVLPPDVPVVRESPPFSGPAAAVGAGMTELARLHARDGARQLSGHHVTLLLACDMPHVSALVGTLLEAVRQQPSHQVWIPLDVEGRLQYMACAVKTPLLQKAMGAAGNLAGKPVRALLASLQRYTFTTDSTADVDTPADVAAFGIQWPGGSSLIRGVNDERTP